MLFALAIELLADALPVSLQDVALDTMTVNGLIFADNLIAACRNDLDADALCGQIGIYDEAHGPASKLFISPLRRVGDGPTLASRVRMKLPSGVLTSTTGSLCNLGAMGLVVGVKFRLRMRIEALRSFDKAGLATSLKQRR
jgi:hypothetical protein